MASGYKQFTNEAGDAECGIPDVPPTYEETCAKPCAPPMEQTQYPAQHHSQYPPQQPAQFPQQQPSPYVYQQQVTQVPVQQNVVHVTNQTMPNDYFGFALFVTFCCCLPFGIVALIKSSEVRTRSAVGDFHGASLSSAEAKRWSTVGLIFGVVMTAISAVSIVVTV